MTTELTREGTGAALDTDQFEALRDFLDRVGIARHRLAPDGRILLTNEAELAALGYRHDEYVGHPVRDFHADPAEADRMLARLARGETLADHPVRLLARDGNVREFLLDAVPRFADGRLDYAYCLMRPDPRAEAAITESERRFREFAQTMPALLATLDPSGVYEFCNDAFVEYTGLTLEEARDWRARGLVHPDDLENMLGAWRHGFATGEPVRLEVRLRRYDGAYRWFLVRGAAAHREDGDIERWVTTSIDIHDRKRAEELAARRRRALAVLSAASRDFTALTSDLPRLLATAVQHGADALGDGCGIQLLDAGAQSLTLGAARHRDPHVTELLHAIFAAGPNDAHAAAPARVLAATEPIVATQVDEDRLRRMVNPQFHAVIDACGVSSFIAIPLRAAGELLGTFTFTRDRGSEPYSDDDVLLATELAHRAATAIRHARNLEALNLSESIYRRLAESTPACVLLVAPDGGVLHCNEFFLEYSGLTREQLAEQGWMDLIHPRDLEGLTSAFPRAMSEGDDFVSEYRIRRHDGVYRWNLSRTVRIRNERGAPERFVNVTIDIDDRRRNEHREHVLMEAAQLDTPLDLDVALARLASVAVPELADCAVTFAVRDGHPAMIALRCGDGEIEQQAIEGAEASLRAARSDLGVIRALQTGESDFYPTFETAWERVTDDPEQVARYRRLQPRSYMVVALKWSGRIFGALSLINYDPYRRFTREDLALAEEFAEKAAAAMENARLYEEATETAERLREANQAKDDFLGLVSHELRTPITVILGDAQVLRNRSKLLDEESRMAALDDIHSESERLNRIIENLLVLARMEREPQDVEPVHVTRTVEREAKRFGERASSREVIISITGGDALVTANEFAIEQTVRNFLSNADKYSPAGSPIDVRVHRRADSVVVSVLDRGPGIAEEEIERIFEPFYRSARTAAASGVGIGLTVCKRVIESHGGRVWAERRDSGGTILSFSLPLTEDDDL